MPQGALRQWMPAYHRHLVGERGVSTRTLGAYVDNAAHFVNFLESEGVREPAEVQRGLLRQYVASLSGAGLREAQHRPQAERGEILFSLPCEGRGSPSKCSLGAPITGGQSPGSKARNSAAQLPDGERDRLAAAVAGPIDGLWPSRFRSSRNSVRVRAARQRSLWARCPRNRPIGDGGPGMGKTLEGAYGPHGRACPQGRPALPAGREARVG